jgi:gliding motility-associated protein GldM
MGHGKETPRQKMIGMMYLVLTALLALNVSKDILNAFVIVNNGLEVTNEAFDKKNNKLYADFDKQLGMNRLKVEPFHKAAQDAKILADTLYNFLQKVKKDIIIKTDGKPEMADSAVKNIMLVESKDNYDIPTNFFLGDGTQPENPDLLANKIKERLNVFRQDLIALFDRPELKLSNTIKETIKSKLGDLGIDTNDPKTNSEDPADKYWSTSKFYHLPIVACITVLSQLQNNVQNAESQVVSELLGAFGAEDFKFDVLEAKVVPKSTVVTSGSSYEADLFVAAYSTTDKPMIYVGSGLDTSKGELIPPIDSVPIVSGVGKLTMPASSVGEKKYSAIIKVKTPTGDYKPYFLKDISYTVAQPMAVVSPTKMNVLYIGVDNPLDISVSGYTDDKVSASITGGGSLVRSGKGWVARVSTQGKCNINVSVKDEKGTGKSMGSPEFRVKRIPDPVAKIGGQKEGLMAKNMLIAQTGVKAEMEGFDFDINVAVTEFIVTASVKGFQQEKISRSNAITQDQKELINRLERGSKVYFEGIKAKMPNGEVRNLPPVILKLN